MSQLFDGIDDASAQLIVQLQLHDSESITSSILNTQSGGRVEAAQLPGLMAVLLFEEDMQRTASVLQDRRYAIAIARNVAPRANARRFAAPGKFLLADWSSAQIANPTNSPGWSSHEWHSRREYSRYQYSSY